MARTARRQLEGQHLLFGEYCGAEQPLPCTIEDELNNIDGGKHVFKLGSILNESKPSSISIMNSS